jgi:hypothetical protein
VLALKIDGGLSFAEIGMALGVSPNTAASRYRYALERLRARSGGLAVSRFGLDEGRGDAELRSLERELFALASGPGAGPGPELRTRVLTGVRAEAARRTNAARAAGLVFALAAASLVLTRPAPLPSPFPSAPAPSPDEARVASSDRAAELGLDPREETRLALLALGRAALPRVAPAVHPESFQPTGTNG